MDIFDGWSLTTQEMKLLNMCRLYLQVVSVADITSLNGNVILSKYMECNRVRKSTMLWPKQVEPPKRATNVWLKAIRRLTLGQGTLIIPLGKWTIPTHQMWKYMLEKTKGRLL